MDELQPAEMVWGLINTHTLARCMHVIAEFGVADALENRPASAAQLARRKTTIPYLPHANATAVTARGIEM